MKSTREIIEVDGVKHTTCTHCGELKPIDQFHKKASSSLGLQPWCKKCTLEKQKEVNHARKDVVASSPSDLPDKPLNRCTPRDLMVALKAWGYTGTLHYTQTIDISRI